MKWNLWFQITTYGHKDENNKWLIKKVDVEPGDDDPVELLKQGDFLRLEHLVWVVTGRIIIKKCIKMVEMIQATCYVLLGQFWYGLTGLYHHDCCTALVPKRHQAISNNHAGLTMNMASYESD